jgi:predicted regulator of Ras-like GTPase activity (Roadblock/LC7/MglB family)
MSSLHMEAGPHTFDWILSDFVRKSDGVRDAVAVSSDGLLIAMSQGLNRDEADHLAAMVAGLASLARGAARRYDFGGMKLLMIEMHRGFLLVSSMTEGGCVGVLADSTADLGLIGYGIAVLADRAGDVLTPATIAELRSALPSA